MNIIYAYLTVFILAVLSSYSLTPIIKRIAHKRNFVDNPQAHKVHKKATPLLGGLSVFIVFFCLSLYLIFTTEQEFNLAVLGYLLGGLIIVVIGVIDDKYGMKPIIKILGQFVPFLIFIFTNKLLNLLGPAYVTVPILFLWMVGLMNALNFLDNMDGIISGMSGIIALGFYAISFLSNQALESEFMAFLSLIFAGSVFGFLPHNFNPAKIFLGDAGSMFIGYFLSTMGILTGKLAVKYHGNEKIYFLIPVLLLSYAIFDISLVSITRKSDGRKISQGGQDHTTHRIGNVMGSPKITALIIYFINIVIVLITILLFKTNSKLLLISATILFALVFLFFGKKLNSIPVHIPKNQLKQ